MNILNIYQKNKYCHTKCWPSTPKVYRDRGNPWPSKYRKAIHQKYYSLIDKHLNREAETSGGVKAPKVLEPQRSNGA
jgi:hypothetical protein